jgi:hypothetical protein
MRLVLTPNDKKILAITAIVFTVVAILMKIVLHFAPLAYTISN